ncbi:MAG: hypothetical protein LKJ47_03125 [Bifidobacteriaceae bacterium]|jgi:tetratricopeptide (TPR) repeat protein|nr:hypothetical protein [Bifidobacteriaceae bacterium]
MPAGMEWAMLSKDEKLRLRSLSKEHAENIGLHMLAAYSLEEENPEQALEHAQWIAKQASRVDIARETLAFISYRAGDYKTALKEFRTARRMNGEIDYLPFIADSERGVGHPEKAIEIALSDDAKDLEGDSKAEMLLVFAGAYADLGKVEQAIKIVDTLGKSKGVSGGYRMRAIQAEQNFLDQAGRHDESMALESEAERLEEAFADLDESEMEEEVVDNDLEEVPDSVLEGLGIDLSDFRSYDTDDDEDGESDETPSPNFGDPANASGAAVTASWSPVTVGAENGTEDSEVEAENEGDDPHFADPANAVGSAVTSSWSPSAVENTSVESTEE